MNTQMVQQSSLPISLEQYYSEAGPDYAAWSPEFNMHMGYYRACANPLRRERMLDQMNAEVLARLQLDNVAEPKLLDLGCGLGATIRSIGRRVPDARLQGITRVPWQVEQARILNHTAGCTDRVRIMQGDYEGTNLPSRSYDGVYALESSCYARGADKANCSWKRIASCALGGVWWSPMASSNGTSFSKSALQQRIFRKLSDCWVDRRVGSA